MVTASSRVFDPGYYMLPNYDHKYRNWNRTGDGYAALGEDGDERQHPLYPQRGQGQVGHEAQEHAVELP